MDMVIHMLDKHIVDRHIYKNSRSIL